MLEYLRLSTSFFREITTLTRKLFLSFEVNFQLFAVVSPCTRFVRFEIYGYDVRGNFGLHRELEY